MDEPTVLEWIDGIKQAPNLPSLKDVYKRGYVAAQRLSDIDSQNRIRAAYEKAKGILEEDNG